MHWNLLFQVSLHIFFTACLQPLLVLFLRSKSAANVTFRLVDIQHHPRLRRKRRVDVDQAVRDILVHRGLRNPKPLCCLPHRRVLVYDLVGNLDCPLFDIFLHGLAPECFLQDMTRVGGLYEKITVHDGTVILPFLVLRRPHKLHTSYII